MGSETSPTAETTPFRINVAQSELDDLQNRLARTRWPDGLPDVGWDYGMPLDYLQELTDYWRRGYDWRAGTAGSSARLFEETGRDLASAREPSTVPTGMAVFPHDPLLPIRSIVERFHNIVHWSEFDQGGHFPALESPDLLIQDLRTFFRSFRPTI